MSGFELTPEHAKRFLEFYNDLPKDFLPPELVVGLQRATPMDILDRPMTWRKTLCKTFPRNSIPPKLTLKPSYSYQPPRFLFGWAMEQSALCAAAELCGFLREARSGQTLAATVTLKKVLSEKLPEVIEALGWVVIHPVMAYRDGRFTTLQCITLADCWITGSRKPSPKHVEALREFFHIGEGDIQPANSEPQWWMDMLVSSWHYGYRNADLSHYRPWDLKPRAKK